MYTWCAISYFFKKINVIIMATFHTFCPQNAYWIWCILQQVDPKINRDVFCQWNFVLLYHKKKIVEQLNHNHVVNIMCIIMLMR